MSNKLVARAALLVLAVSILGRLAGFVREQVIAIIFGTSMQTDAYLMAFTLPNLFYVVIGGALATAFIPVFTSQTVNKGTNDASRTASTIINLTALAMLVLTILGMAASPLLISGIAHGFSPEAKALTVKLSIIMFPCVLFMAVSLLLGGVLNSLKHFAAPAFTSVAFSLTIIAIIYILAPELGIYALALGTLLGCIMQVIIQLPVLRRRGVKYSLSIDTSDPAVRQVGKLMLPAMIGTTVNQIYIVVDRLLASGLPVGSIAALNFANKLMYLPYNLFVFAVNTAVFPVLAEHASRQRFNDLGKTTVFGLNLIAFFTIPAAVGLGVLSRPLVILLFQHGAFDQRSTEMTVFALNFFVIGLFAQGAYNIINRTYFAMQDTRTPVLVSLLVVGLNVIFSLVLIQFLAHGGLALANALASTVNMCLIYWFLRRRLPELPERQLFLTLGKIIAASSVMGLAVYGSRVVLSSWLGMATLISQGLVVALAIIIGLVVYTAAILPMKIEEVEYVKSRMLSRLSR
ncbi:MAG: murein biosynthesis integral membrane protein MurJ [Methylocystaceae bacterium]